MTVGRWGQGRTPSSEPRKTRGVQSLQRATLLLELLGELGEAGVTELARQLGWSKSMAHRQASTLLELGYLEQDPHSGRYRLGIRLFELGSRVLRGRDVRDVASPIMDELVRKTEEVAHLAVLDEPRVEVVYIHKVDPPQTIRLYTEVGGHHPAYCAATGKILLAHLPPERLRAALQRATLRSHTARTITERAALLRQLEQVRARGFAIDDEEYREGVRGVAAPIFDHTGHVVAAVNAGGPSLRLSLAELHRITGDVVAAAANISRELGHRFSK